MTRLLILDVAGTLVRLGTTEPYPQVADKVAAWRGPVAIVTNQPGPLWRLVMGRTRYPDLTGVAAYLAEVATALPVLKGATWFVSLGHPKLTHQLPADTRRALAAALSTRLRREGLEVFTSTRVDWHKPHPGMLLAACRHFGVATTDALMVGDQADDSIAAARAGVPFRWANDWRGEQGGVRQWVRRLVAAG